MNKSPLISKPVLLSVLALIVTLTILLVVFQAERAPPDDRRNLPVPDISQQPLVLRVAYASNPRFSDLTEVQLKAVLQHATLLMKQHFAVDVVFEVSEPVTVAKLFEHLPEPVKQYSQSAIIDPRYIDQYMLTHMRYTLYKQLVESASGEHTLLDYAKPHLLSNKQATDLSSLSHALIDTQLTRLMYWYEHNAADGNPVIDDSPYNQWVWWDTLGYGELPYDVVITNQLVASMETYDVAMHSALRGGINGGTMTYSKQGRYGGYAFVSVFALLHDADMLARLRDDTHYSDEQIVHYAAATLAHELGHLFFHYDHPYGASECLMNPTPLLRYREWYAGLNAEACRARQLPQMQTGAVKIGYHANW